MGRLKIFIIAISISVSSLLFAESTVSDSSNTEKILNDISTTLDTFYIQYDGYFNSLYDFLSDSFGYYVLGDSLNANVTTPIVEELNTLILNVKSIHDIITQQGGTKENWQTLLEQTANQENWQHLLQQTANEENWQQVTSNLSSILEEIQKITENPNADYSQEFLNLNNMLEHLVELVDLMRSIEYEVFGTVTIGGFDDFQQQLFNEGIPVDVDLSPVVSNQLTQIENQVESNEYLDDISISNQMATNLLGQILDEIKDPEIQDPRPVVEEVVSSTDYSVSGIQNVYDDSQHYLTNLTNSVDIKEWEYDYSDYTNVNRVIYKLKNDSFYTDALNTTNTIQQAGTKLETTIKGQLQSIKPFFSRNYDSWIVINWDLLEYHNVIDLADYVKFDSSILINLYDFVLWVLTFITCFYIIRKVWEF